jgi:hypothetical protein
MCREHRNSLLLAFDQRPFVPDLVQGFCWDNASGQGLPDCHGTLGPATDR